MTILDELDDLRRRALADSLVEAVVLCAVGVVGLVGQVLELATTRSSGWSDFWWWLATPAAFALSWGMLRWRRRVVGVGTRTRALGWVTVGLVVLALLMPFAFFVFGPYPALMGGVLIVGVYVRSRLMVGWALIGGALGTLAGLYFFGNRSGDLGHWMPQLDDAVGIGVAAVTLGLGVRAALRARQP